MNPWFSIIASYLNSLLNMIFPTFLSIPAFDVGIPISFAIFCFNAVMPTALFHEKLSPGIIVLFLPCQCALEQIMQGLLEQSQFPDHPPHSFLTAL